MLSCIFLAGSLFFQDGGELMNFHHATRISLNNRGDNLRVDFGEHVRHYDVPDAWSGLNIEALVQRCALEGEARGRAAANTALNHEHAVELKPLEGTKQTTRRKR